MNLRMFGGALAVAASSFVFCQDSGPRLPKPDQERIFHSGIVHGTDAATVQRAYEQRLRMEIGSPFQGLKWRNVGPEVQGGRVVDIAAPLGDPQKVYVAYATGGLWRTKDEGISWESLFDNQSAFGIGAIAVSRDGKTLWLGTGEANSQRTSYAGTGVFKSSDEGKTWHNVGLPESQHIGKILIDPKNENIVYVAALGHLYSRNPDRGVYKTVDGGRTWALVLKVDDQTGAIDMTIDPRNPSVLLASMWQRDRRAWDFQESGAGSGVYRTTSGGRNWQKVAGLPTGYAAGRTGLSLCRNDPSVVYAFVDNQEFDPDWEFFDDYAPSGRLTFRRFLRLSDATIKDVPASTLSTFLTPYVEKPGTTADRIRSGKLSYKEVRELIEAKNKNAFTPDATGAELYRSNDGGKSFHKTDTANFGGIGGYYWGTVQVNPVDPNDVTVTGVPLIHSLDGGKTWTRIAEYAHVDFHAVWHDPRDPQKVWIGCDGGLYISPDDGKTVRHLNTVPTAQATTLALDNKVPYNIYMGLQDNGTMKGPSNYVPGKSEITAWQSIFGGDGSAVAIDPRKDGETVYVSFQFGSNYGKNQTTNEVWNTRPTPAKGDPGARFNWIAPLIVSSHDPDIVYAGAQRLYRSFDMGHKYEPISPDLTLNRPQGNVPFSTIKDISESPLRFGLIYVGTDDGRVKMTPDGGFQWIDVSTPAGSKWVSRVVASNWDVGRVYVSQSGYREDDFAPYLWKSTDFGKTWQSITANLPMETINVIREDPAHKGFLYVGTDMGVYASMDDGLSWEPLPGAMPHTPVHDLAIQARDNELVAATHSHGAYILPLKNLDRLTPEVRKKDLELFDIPDVSRSPNAGMQPRERWDSSAPDEPTVEIVFYSDSAGKSILRLKDSKGVVLKEQTVETVFGLNVVMLGLQLKPGKRFVPTKLPPAKTAQEALADVYAANRPLTLPVGKYTMELEHAGKSVSKPLAVVSGTLRSRFRRRGGDVGDGEGG